MHFNVFVLNKIKKSHSDGQKYTCYRNGINSPNFSYVGSHKELWIGFVIFLEMTGRVFLVELCGFF